MDTQIKLRELLRHEGGLTGVVSAPNDDKYLYVLKQKGRIFRFSTITQQLDPIPFLDLREEIEMLYKTRPMKVKFPDERGLLSLAFHPEYSTTGSLFQGVFIVINSQLNDSSKYDKEMQLETPDPDHMTCVAQYRYTKGNTPQQTMNSRMDMFCIPEPQANHNGGGLVFGPDGFLWIGMGDGGGANDEHGALLDSSLKDSYLGSAQNINSLKGKLLRIEVIQPMSQGVPYLIPQDNPFVSNGEYESKNGRPEIAAWGFRNPWRMSFDSNGDLWVGDVGQNRVESIKLVTGVGGNYGWRALEGNEIFNQSVLKWIESKQESIISPYLTYHHRLPELQTDVFGVAIVGVINYRGHKIPDLMNHLIVADHSGKILAANLEDKIPTLRVLADLKMNISSLDEDNQGELYISSFNIGLRKGIVYVIEPNFDITNTSISTTSIEHGLTDKDVEIIVQQAINKAHKVKSALRIRDGEPSHTQMHIAIIKKGERTASLRHSMDGAWYGSIDIAKRKAFTALAFSSDENALTTRGIRALSQPSEIKQENGMSKISDIALWQLGNSNPEGGIIEFPGGIPLYKYGKLIGALGVSGDAVDQDETVARGGVNGYEASMSIRSDTVAKIPYYGELAPELPIMVSSSHHFTISSHSKPIKIVGREEWNHFRTQHPTGYDGFIALSMSGDRETRSIREYSDYAPNFISMVFFHSRLNDLNGVQEFINLRQLNVSRTEITDNDLQYLSKMTKLKRLELNGNDLIDLHPIKRLNIVHLGLACLNIRSIEPLRNMKTIQILDLYQNPNLIDVDALKSLSNLVDLDIRGINVGDDILKYLRHKHMILIR
jgi:uncharacterized protein GlcG (DUF336 family)/glucose/arabinose dehydrogenase